MTEMFVYVIAGHDADRVKIGSSNSPETRVKALGRKALGLRVHASVPVGYDEVLPIERYAQCLLYDKKCDREWFTASVDEAIGAVHTAVEAVRGGATPPFNFHKPKMDGGKIIVTLPDTLRHDIDEARREEPDIPARSEMMRRLIEEAIAVRRKKGAAK